MSDKIYKSTSSFGATVEVLDVGNDLLQVSMQATQFSVDFTHAHNSVTLSRHMSVDDARAFARTVMIACDRIKANKKQSENGS